MELPYAEPYRIKMIEPITLSNRAEREKWIKEAKYNLFNLSSKQVYIDLLTDSGTGAMSQEQWAAIMTGDESYAGAESFYKLRETVQEITGFDYFLPTHQGRAAENVLFSVLINAGDIIPGNSHFDTTKGHIEFRKAVAIDCTTDEAKNTSGSFPFKGNIDVHKLERIIKQYGKEKIPFVLITITNNSAGGQPVSMANIVEVSNLVKQHSVDLYIDGARFAENAFFIKQNETDFSDWDIKAIVKKMFSYADGMTMSAKKDGYVNIGGFIALRKQEVYESARKFNILFEGFSTYGGMAGRDMNALAVGLQEAMQFETLQARIKQVAYLGQRLEDFGIPVQHPFGGHAIFVNASEFLPHIPIEQYVAQALAIELYLEAGVRAVEIGTLLADRDPLTRENRYPAVEFLRLAVPRRTYTNNHLDVVAAALKNVYDKRGDLKTGYRIIKEAPIMRHFTIELEKV
jgi:tryptophanase